MLIFAIMYRYNFLCCVCVRVSGWWCTTSMSLYMYMTPPPPPPRVCDAGAIPILEITYQIYGSFSGKSRTFKLNGRVTAREQTLRACGLVHVFNLYRALLTGTAKVGPWSFSAFSLVPILCHVKKNEKKNIC